MLISDPFQVPQEVRNIEKHKVFKGFLKNRHAVDMPIESSEIEPSMTDLGPQMEPKWSQNRAWIASQTIPKRLSTWSVAAERGRFTQMWYMDALVEFATPMLGPWGEGRERGKPLSRGLRGGDQ